MTGSVVTFTCDITTPRAEFTRIEVIALSFIDKNSTRSDLKTWWGKDNTYMNNTASYMYVQKMQTMSDTWKYQCRVWYLKDGRKDMAESKYLHFNGKYN